MIRNLLLSLAILFIPNIALADETFHQQSQALQSSNEDVLTGEDAKVLNSYTDNEAQSVVIMYDNGTVIIYNKLSGKLIGINVATSKILVQDKNGHVFLKCETGSTDMACSK